MTELKIISEFNIVQLLSLVVACISLLLSLFIYFRTRKSRILAYTVSANFFLLFDIIELNSDLSIKYKNTELKNLRYFQIQVGNKGNDSIEPEDFFDDIHLKFNSDAKILQVEIEEYETQPSNLDTKINTDINSVSIKPILLNSGDYFTLNMLIADFSNFKGIQTRIKGITNVSKVKFSMTPYFFLIPLGIALIIFSLQSVEYTEITKTITTKEGSFNWQSIVLIVLGTISLILGLGSSVNPEFHRNRLNPFQSVRKKYKNPAPESIGMPI